MLLLDLKGLDHYFRSANISVPLTALRFSGPAAPGTGGDVLMPHLRQGSSSWLGPCQSRRNPLLLSVCKYPEVVKGSRLQFSFEPVFSPQNRFPSLSRGLAVDIH